MKFHSFWIILLSASILSCNPFKTVFIKKHFEFTESIYHNHSGLALYDPQTGKYLYQHDAAKYFTPASNTKVLTFYAALVLLGDSIPAIQFIEKDDSLIFWGTGDPSLLNSQMHHNTVVYTFLNNTQKHLYFSSSNYTAKHFGPGWAWDDYSYTFSTERSPMPIYNNTIQFSKQVNQKAISVSSPYFRQHIYLSDTIEKKKPFARYAEDNTVLYFPTKRAFNERIPFRYHDFTFTQLLSDTLNKPVKWIAYKKPKTVKTLYSIPVDSVYKIMMQDSDNFLAEQTLFMCSNTALDSINPVSIINYVKRTYLYDLPDEPVWKDGSGLSRYNLLTPRSIVKLWEKIYNETDHDRLFSLVATGGESGTLKNYYKAFKPYIYGKTGTMSNVHNLSGFIKTKKGRVLIFSYMNNNYPVSSSEIKPAMERLMLNIYNKY